MGKSSMNKRGRRDKARTPDRKGPKKSVETWSKGGSKAAKNIEEVSVHELTDMILQYDTDDVEMDQSAIKGKSEKKVDTNAMENMNKGDKQKQTAKNNSEKNKKQDENDASP